MPVCVRFAPSPTGRLHLGNARIAVVNWLMARCRGGRYLLRFDDTDRSRCRPEYRDAIREDLDWLGLDRDGEYRQSERGTLYAAAFTRLREAGRVYPCYETPEELAALRETARRAGRPPRYRPGLGLPEEERRRREGKVAPHWRFALPDRKIVWEDLVFGRRGIRLGEIGDPVVRRADGSWTYIFASAVDDLDLAISHVIRGEDHLTNTAVQIALCEALGGGPPAFAHLPLLLGADGAPLAKRGDSVSLAELREKGVEPRAVLAVLARLGTGRPAGIEDDVPALCRDFDLAAYGRAPARLDPRELRRLSARMLRAMSFAEAAPRLEAMGLDRIEEDFWLAVRPNLERFSEIADWWRICREPLTPVREDPAFLERAAALLPERITDAERAQAWLKELARSTGRRGRELYRPLRLALTGQEHGPELKHLLPLIGAPRARARLLGRRA